MAGAGVEPALNLYPAEREGLALPGYQKSKSYESRITAILCGEGESNPSTRFTDKRPDLPLAGPSLLSAGAGLSRLSIDNYVWYMNASLRWREGGESNPASDRNSLSFPFQAELHSRACFINVLRESDGLPSWNPGRASPPPGQLQSLY